MSSYIGKVQIGESDSILIGSTLFGTCNDTEATTAKVVDLPDFDTKMKGITVHVKFVNGNSATENVTLTVGSTAGAPVTGNCVCQANEIIAFTYEQISDENGTVHEYWRAERGVKIEIDQNNIITKINGQDVNAATKTYVDNRTAGLSGLTGAMHFRGETPNSDISGHPIVPNSEDSFNNYDSGDVLLVGNQEYVYSKGATAATSQWILLGDEGSYALKSSTDTITEVSSFTANTLPTLTVTPTDTSKVTVTNGSAASLTTNDVTVPNVTAAGSATTASVSGGILNITIGAPPTIAATPITIKAVDEFTANTPTSVTAQTVSVGSASGWNAGTQASLNTNDTIVVVPNATNS